MTNNAVKEKLLLYLDLKKELHDLRKRLRELEYALFSPGHTVADSVRKSKGRRSGMSLADAHLDLQRRCQEKQAEILAAQLQFEKMIYPLEPRERLLLRYRYLDGLHWDEISKKLDCNVSQAHRIHNSTLAELKQNAEK